MSVSAPLRIVIIDDSAEDRAQARRWVLEGSQRRCQFTEADSGSAGIDAILHAATGLPDCVLLDFNLPDMSATEVLVGLASTDGAMPCPVLVMTGGDHPDLGRQALRAGAHDFIGKSWISTSALARAMDNAAERWQMDRELREQRVVLQQQAERDVYFLRLGEAMRHYSDPADLKQAMVQLLGRHLQASRVVLWQFQKDDWAVVDQCYSDGESQFEGRYPLDDFVRLLFAKLRAGHNVISADIQNDPDYSPAQKAACEALQLAAHLSVPIFSDGELLGVIGVYQCRPRRWTENEVELVKSTAQRMNDTVSRALAQRRLRDSEQLLLEESRHKDEFLATLAHELRNPLAPIRNGLAFLQRQALHAPAIATIHMMDRQLTQMVHLVDDLLDVSRIRLGKIVLRRELLSVSDIFDAVVEVCLPFINARRQTLTVELPQDPVFVDGDTTRLVQVFCNLLSNASKYSEPGSLLRFAVARHSGTVDIQVQDTGAGISTEELTTIWEMFTQAHNTLDKAQGGLGIGLPLARKLVELHGGSIHAFSDGLGKGSVFSVKLPEVLNPEQAALPHRAAATAIGAGKRIGEEARRVLIVDDNEDNALSLAALVELDGHVVATATDGLQALKLANTFLPQIVLLDIGLPGMDGFEVAARLRVTSVVQPRIVAMTGWGSAEDKRKSELAGFDEHWVKPLNLANLKKLLSEDWLRG